MRTGSALSGSSERDTHRGDLALEGAGARPARRHDAVGYQEPCDPARPIKVADPSERVFLLDLLDSSLPAAVDVPCDHDELDASGRFSRLVLRRYVLCSVTS
jgi:hypothetical protein